MTRILLIHGSCHGAWCWRDVIPLLRAAGHEAWAIDLPSHGGDTTAIGAVTLAAYADRIIRELDAPTVLVGHSAGGYAIAEAAARAPENVAGLVYLCAYRPEGNRSMVDMMKDAPTHPLKGALDVAADRKSFRFRPDCLEDRLYQDCPNGTTEMARALLDWQAIAPQSTPLSGAVAEHISQDYIICANDRTIPPAHQEIMAKGLSPDHVHRLATGHSPFFAAPQALSDCIVHIDERQCAEKTL